MSDSHVVTPEKLERFWNGVCQVVNFSALTGVGAGAHNCVYRGKYLGSSVTAEQWAAIAAGTFDDLYIGDYWTINGVNWRIAAFDYWYGKGDVTNITHHIVIVPDECLVLNILINTTNITTGAYVGSNFYSGANSNTGKSQATSIVNTAFPQHILTYRTVLKSATKNGYELSGGWYDCTVELMNELQIFGSEIFNGIINGTGMVSRGNIDCVQFPLFQFNPIFIKTSSTWWLRDVADTQCFSCVGAEGNCGYAAAKEQAGIRPCFGICAENISAS